jgi:hypothetical protein
VARGAGTTGQGLEKKGAVSWGICESLRQNVHLGGRQGVRDEVRGKWDSVE